MNATYRIFLRIGCDGASGCRLGGQFVCVLPLGAQCEAGQEELAGLYG